MTRVSFAQAVRVWAKIGLLGFGGPAGQVALMHRELVEERRWIDEERFLHALNYCMLLPGPEAQQLAIYIGWLLHRTRGGVVAGSLFVLPGFFAMLLLSALYAALGQLPLVAALFFGLKAAVFSIVVEAVLRIGKRALKRRSLLLIAALSFVAIFVLGAPFPLVVLGAGACGLLGSLARRSVDTASATESARPPAGTLVDRMAAAGELAHTLPSRARVVRVVATFALLWGAPVALVVAATGPSSVYSREALFFSKAAVVTFGGAYAVLAYIAQQAVEAYHWLKPGEMLDGLGLAETTPGPLIMVVQFVGFLGAFRNPGGLLPLWAGVAGSLVTVWVTFVPCFFWIFLGAPYIEALRQNRALAAALSAITAAVVGVILNLSLWLGLHTLFARVVDRSWGVIRLPVPDVLSLDVKALVLSTFAMLALFRFKLGLPKTLAASAALGMAWKLLG